MIVASQMADAMQEIEAPPRPFRVVQKRVGHVSDDHPCPTHIHRCNPGMLLRTPCRSMNEQPSCFSHQLMQELQIRCFFKSSKSGLGYWVASLYGCVKELDTIPDRIQETKLRDS